MNCVISSPMRAFKKWGACKKFMNSKEIEKKYKEINSNVISGAALKDLLLDSVKDAQLLLDGYIPVELFRPSLTHLDIPNSQFSHVFFEQIFRRCPHIKEAILCECYDFEDKCMQSLLKYTKGVEALHLSGCRRLTDASVNLLLKQAPDLHTLDIGGCFNLSPEGVESVCDHPNRRKFVELDISGTQFNQETVKKIAQHFPSLNVVGLGYSSIIYSDDDAADETLTTLSSRYIYENTLLNLLSHCRRLTEVRLHFCTGISGAILEHMIVTLGFLQRLDLCGAKGFSFWDIGQLIAARCPTGRAIGDEGDEGRNNAGLTLTYLNVKFCFDVPRKTQEAWQQHYPRVQFIYDT